jgi:hypothetical protein
MHHMTTRLGSLAALLPIVLITAACGVSTATPSPVASVGAATAPATATPAPTATAAATVRRVATFIYAGHGWAGPTDEVSASGHLYATEDGGRTRRLIAP